MARYLEVGGVDYRLIGTDKVLLTNDDNSADFRQIDGDWKIYAGAGNDHIYGNAGENFIDAGDGNDIVTGGYGHDTIFGGSGSDILDGSRGDDYLNGGTGNDIIFAASNVGQETDNDTIFGGDGNDRFYYGQAGYGNDTVKDYKAGDGFVFEGVASSAVHVVDDGNGNALITVDGRQGSITVEHTAASEVAFETSTSYADWHAGFVAV